MGSLGLGCQLLAPAAEALAAFVAAAVGATGGKAFCNSSAAAAIIAENLRVGELLAMVTI